MTETLFLAAVFALGILSGRTAAAVGFGVGSLLTPLLLTRFEPHIAIGVVALPHLIATATRYVHYRKWVDRAVLIRFGLPSAIGGTDAPFYALAPAIADGSRTSGTPPGSPRHLAYCRIQLQ